MEALKNKDSYENNELQDIKKQIKEVLNSQLPDDIKKKLVEGYIKVEEEYGVKRKELLNSFSKDIKSKISSLLGLNTKDVDSAFVNGLKELPENKNRIVENISKDIAKNKNEFIKKQPTIFIDLKTSYTQVDKNTYLENDGFVGPVYHYLGNPDYNIYNVPYYKQYENNLKDTLDILNKSSSYEDFIKNLNNRSELDFLLREKAKTEVIAEKLQVLSYIADINLYNSKMFSESSDEQLKAANEALSTNYSPEEYFSILKESLVQKKHIDATTCIQLHTFIAKTWEDLGLGEGITSTVDIGVAHRLAILKDKNSKDLYLISDGLLLKGNSYKELVSLLPGRFVLLHYLYNSDNKQIGTVQTDTEKQVVKNLNGYDFNSVNNADTQSFLGGILDRNNLDYLHRQNLLKLELGNNDKYLFAQHTFDSGFFTDLKATDNNIPAEGNKIKSISIGAGWGNSNIDIRTNVGAQFIDRNTILGKEHETIYHFYTGLLAATDKHYFSNNLYFKASSYADWSMTFENNGIPITNAQGNVGLGFKVGKTFSDGDIYIKASKSYRIETATSLNHNTQIEKPIFWDGGYTMGIGGKYDVNGVSISSEVDYHKEKGEKDLDGNLKIKKGDVGARLKYHKTSYETTILPDEQSIKLEVDKRINDNYLIYGGVEHKEEGDIVTSNKYYMGIKMQF